MRSAMACFSVTGFCDCRANHFVQKLALREWTSGAVTAAGMIFDEGPMVGRARRVRLCRRSRAPEVFGPMVNGDEGWALGCDYGIGCVCVVALVPMSSEVEILVWDAATF